MAAPYVYSTATYTPPAGYIGNLNEVQAQALSDLKARLKVHFDAHRAEFKDDHETRFDDVRCARFLRARQFNVDKALEMIVTDINWRDLHDVKRVCENFPNTPAFQQLYDYWPAREHAKDRYGIGGWWERIALVEAKSFIENVKHEDLLNFHIITQEANEKRFFSVREGGIRHQEGGTFVLDMTGLGLKHLNSAAMGLIKELSAMDEAHYPEMIRKIYITNAPSIFGMFYRVISPWLDKHTAEKIDIISTAKETLTAEFGAENLPQFVGGSCPTKIPLGGTFKGIVSETAFETAVVKDYFELEMTIQDGDAMDADNNVYAINSMIGWNFTVESHDLGFVIYFIPKGASEQERQMLQQYARHATNEGSIVAEQPGKYIFHWDNSFSLWRKKAMQYQIFVEPPLSDSAAGGDKKMLTSAGKTTDKSAKKDKKDKSEKKSKEKKEKKSKDKKHKRTPSTS